MTVPCSRLPQSTLVLDILEQSIFQSREASSSDYNHQLVKYHHYPQCNALCVDVPQHHTEAGTKYNTSNNLYHPRMWHGNAFGRVCVCVSVCLSCSCSNLRKPWPRNFIFGVRVHLQNIHVKFVCQGHWVKVKVTGTKRDIRAYLNMRIRRWSR